MQFQLQKRCKTHFLVHQRKKRVALIFIQRKLKSRRKLSFVIKDHLLPLLELVFRKFHKLMIQEFTVGLTYDLEVPLTYHTLIFFSNFNIERRCKVLKRLCLLLTKSFQFFLIIRAAFRKKKKSWRSRDEATKSPTNVAHHGLKLKSENLDKKMEFLRFFVT